MIKLQSRIILLLRWLDKRYTTLAEQHYKVAPPSGTIPIGGGDWMDLFFRMEALRGCMTALRHGKSVEDAVEEGKTVSEISVSIWNDKREYQVKRWEKTAHDFLYVTVAQGLREVDQQLNKVKK